MSFAETGARQEQGLIEKQRITSVDILRGMIIILMALDHTRDFWHIDAELFSPTDLSKTNALLFITRWITHFCAPVFIFLAGTSAFLSMSRGRSKKDLFKFLISRGLLLIFLEVTFNSFSWNLNFNTITLQILWVIGWSMIFLAFLIFLPDLINALLSILIIACHSMLGGIEIENPGLIKFIWGVLYDGGSFEFAPGCNLLIIYPLIPWLAVMSLGYVFGRLLYPDTKLKRRYLLFIGVILTLAFVIIRYTNIYGDPQPWTFQKNGLFTFLSFINCEKYPPSLLFLLMTLGPAIILLSLLDNKARGLSKPLIKFGRVPLFFYLIHIPFLHIGIVALSFVMYNFSISDLLSKGVLRYDLAVVYLVWLAAVVCLYPVCAWYLRLKENKKWRWLRYL